MHVHTTYSDGLNTPEEMVKAAIKKGLDGLAVTDHDNVDGSLRAEKFAKNLKNDFKIITGTEIRSAKGDILAYGIRENVKPMMSVEETVERIHDLGGIAVAAHPFQLLSVKQGIGEDAIKTDAVEILNSGNVLMRLNKRSEELAKKYNMPVSAGSDSHCILSVGNAGIICDSNPIEAIMKKKVRIFGGRMPYLIMVYSTMVSLPKFLMKSKLPTF
jgi:predicted metal-dependent phosphoesterase TrpH